MPTLTTGESQPLVLPSIHALTRNETQLFSFFGILKVTSLFTHFLTPAGPIGQGVKLALPQKPSHLLPYPLPPASLRSFPVVVVVSSERVSEALLLVPHILPSLLF